MDGWGRWIISIQVRVVALPALKPTASEATRHRDLYQRSLPQYPAYAENMALRRALPPPRLVASNQRTGRQAPLQFTCGIKPAISGEGRTARAMITSTRPGHP